MIEQIQIIAKAVAANHIFLTLFLWIFFVVLPIIYYLFHWLPQWKRIQAYNFVMMLMDHKDVMLLYWWFPYYLLYSISLSHWHHKHLQLLLCFGVCLIHNHSFRYIPYKRLQSLRYKYCSTKHSMNESLI